MCNFATLSDSTLLTLGTKIQKKASEGNQHGIEKIIKACEFSHQYVKTFSEMATNAVSDISTVGAGPSQRGRCTHAV